MKGIYAANDERKSIDEFLGVKIGRYVSLYKRHTQIFPKAVMPVD
jgi:hypothetical protein